MTNSVASGTDYDLPITAIDEHQQEENKIENNENFYIRYFNSENLLKGESMVNYIIDRWKGIS